MKAARTRGHIHRLAVEHGWQVGTVNRTDVLTRGQILVRVRYARNGRLVHVAQYAPNGLNEHPARGKQTYVRQWLTEAS